MSTALTTAATTPVRRSRSTDIDEHTSQLQQLAHWNLRYDQLDCGRFEGQFTNMRFDALQLFVERTTRRVRQRGQLAPEGCVFAVLAGGAGELHLNGMRAGRDELLVAREAAGMDVCTPTDCTLVGAVVNAPALEEAAVALGQLPWRPGRADSLLALAPQPQALAAWRDLLLFALRADGHSSGPLASADAQRLLHDELLTRLVGLLGTTTGDAHERRADARKRMVDRACALLLSQPDAPLSLLAVCREVGASPRKLSYCFQDVLGLSPARFVKTTRLNAVRRELVQGAREGDPPSIYDVAARWGFWHFGHFSSDYKRQFGELPSETLKRAPLH